MYRTPKPQRIDFLKKSIPSTSHFRARLSWIRSNFRRTSPSELSPFLPAGAASPSSTGSISEGSLLRMLLIRVLTCQAFTLFESKRRSRSTGGCSTSSSRSHRSFSAGLISSGMRPCSVSSCTISLGSTVTTAKVPVLSSGPASASAARFRQCQTARPPSWQTETAA
jgi:hypothetical protein